MSFPNPFEDRQLPRRSPPQCARVAETVFGSRGLEVFDDLVGDDAEDALGVDTDTSDFALSAAEQTLHERLEGSEKLFDEAAITISKLTKQNVGTENLPMEATGMLIGAMRSVRLSTAEPEASLAEMFEEKARISGYEAYARGHALLLAGDRPGAEQQFSEINKVYEHPLALAKLDLVEADAKQGVTSKTRIQETYDAFVNALKDGHVQSFIAKDLHHFLRTHAHAAGIDASLLCDALQKSVIRRDRSDERTDQEYSKSKEALEAVTTALELDRPEGIETLLPLITYLDHPVRLHLALAKHAVMRGDVERAEAWFLQAVKKIDDALDASVMVDIVHIAASFPDPIAQLDKIEQTLANDPLLDDDIRLTPVYAALTEAYAARGNRKKAETRFSKLEYAEARLAIQFADFPSPFNQVDTYTSLAQASAALGLDPKPAIRTLQSRFLLPDGKPHPRFTDTFVIPDWHKAIAVSIAYDVDPMPLLRAMKVCFTNGKLQNKELFQIAVHEMTWAKHMVEKTRKEAQN